MIRGRLIERNIIGIINTEKSQYIFYMMLIENHFYIAYLLWRAITGFDSTILIQICFFATEKLIKLILNYQFYNNNKVIKLFQIIASFVSDIDILSTSLSLDREKNDMFYQFLQQDNPKTLLVERDTTISKIVTMKVLHMILKGYFIFYTYFYLNIPAYIAGLMCSYYFVLVGLIFALYLKIKFSILNQKWIFNIYTIFDQIFQCSSRLFSNFIVNQNIFSSIIYYAMFALINTVIQLNKLNVRITNHQYKKQFSIYPKKKSISKKHRSLILRIFIKTFYDAFISMSSNSIFYQALENRELIKQYYGVMQTFAQLFKIAINSFVLQQSYSNYQNEQKSALFLFIFVYLSAFLAYNFILFCINTWLFMKNKSKLNVFMQLVSQNTKLKVTDPQIYQKVKLEFNREIDQASDKIIIDENLIPYNKFFINNKEFLSKVPDVKYQNFYLKQESKFKIIIQDQHIQFTMKKYVPKAIEIFLSYNNYASVDIKENIYDLHERRRAIVSIFKNLVFMNPSIIVSDIKILLGRLNNQEMESSIIQHILQSTPTKLSIMAFFKHQEHYLVINPKLVIYDLFDFD
ncbi:transmembrane protein, putative (macronuclear) [Tetrahymena thermophila SB210]|uniref:Transmembrane protein, putative n=1 Tax=Tetrahymena thermophila (strain SB210) TaxID=312017 RepID=Q22WK0_TETTS|nr:transmembrane protein, putative [Tetrahymena thermophila SB210]EAR89417.2 transmembrane protein, putative [Tetrahymena thermophila SB210]|eukprot:XP_001009662.2 transmembrane protein, putative [Tetrahymena thermophila SB210]